MCIRDRLGPVLPCRAGRIRLWLRQSQRFGSVSYTHLDVYKRQVVKATLIGEAENGTAILSKKIDIGFIGDPVTAQVDFFVQLLQEDRALTGLFTAFPRRA